MVFQFAPNPQFGLLPILICLLFEAVVRGFEVTPLDLVGVLGAGVGDPVDLLAAATMLVYLLRRHPEGLERLRRS